MKPYNTNDALAFLEGKGMDGNGRMIDDYLLFTLDKWEECHNHVQWAFPSHIPSEYNTNAPVVDMKRFVENLSAVGRDNVMLLVEAYLRSLGFQYTEQKWRMDMSNERTRIWVTPYNHNYQRITRLLNLLSHLDPELAKHLWGEFIDVAEIASECSHMHIPFISAMTVVYWSKAAFGKL